MGIRDSPATVQGEVQMNTVKYVGARLAVALGLIIFLTALIVWILETLR